MTRSQLMRTLLKVVCNRPPSASCAPHLLNHLYISFSLQFCHKKIGNILSTYSTSIFLFPLHLTFLKSITKHGPFNAKVLLHPSLSILSKPFGSAKTKKDSSNGS